MSSPQSHHTGPPQEQAGSSPQSDLNFRNVLTASLGAYVATPGVRLTTDDVRSNLHQPGTLTKLLKKVNGSNEKRNKRGSACKRCRTQKRRCDGCFPCGTCLVGGETCVKDQDEAGAKRPRTAIDPPQIESPEPPISPGVQECIYRPKAMDPMCPSLGGKGLLMSLDLGWREADKAAVFSALPRRLCSALDRLSCVIRPMIQAANMNLKRPNVPQFEDLYESSKVAVGKYRFEPDGSKVLIHNQEVCVHWGEMSQRLYVSSCLAAVAFSDRSFTPDSSR